MTKQTLIVLTVLDDQPDREWWEALGLPDPARWSLSDTFDGHVFPSVTVEREIAR